MQLSDGDPGEGAGMDFPRLVRTVSHAPWLPPGSSAEVWVGEDLDIPRPTVIVRLLLIRAPGEIFCVSTDDGLDIPAAFLGREGGWRAAADGVAQLCGEYLGAVVSTRCVGYVRHIVPEPGESYRLPVPAANILVFTPRDPARMPIAERGAWVGREQAPGLLGDRHWWPIAVEAGVGGR